MRSTIIAAMAASLWDDACFAHVEREKCCSLQGYDTHLPRPLRAYALASMLARDFEASNGCSVADLYEDALRADERAGNLNLSREECADSRLCSPKWFGRCLVLDAQGSGRQWTDDHEPFGLVAHTARPTGLALTIGDQRWAMDTDYIGSELEALADDACDECARLAERAAERQLTPFASARTYNIKASDRAARSVLRHEERRQKRLNRESDPRRFVLDWSRSECEGMPFVTFYAEGPGVLAWARTNVTIVSTKWEYMGDDVAYACVWEGEVRPPKDPRSIFDSARGEGYRIGVER